MIDRDAAPEPAARGLNASPGAASGAIVFDADTAVERGGVRAGDPRPLRDDAGRHPRDDRRAGHPHRPRRHDLARGGRRARDGQAVRGRLRRPRARRTGRRASAARSCAEGDVITIDGGTGSVYVGEIPLVPPQLNEDFETVLGWADDAAPPEGARERGHARGRRARARVRRRGDRPLPHRAHVLRRGAAAGRAGDDPRRRRGRAAAPRSTGCCRSSSPTSRGSSRRWPGLPVTIRLLDPPLHEFLPPRGAGDRRQDARPDPRRCARRTRCSARAAAASGSSSRRSTRCRSGRSRARRAVGAAASAARRDHAPARRLRRGAAPPARADRAHLGRGGARRRRTSIGTMIELPRACVRADEIAARRGLLLVRDERPDADGARLLARRRRGQVPHALPRGRRARAQPVRGARPGGRRRPDADRGRARPRRRSRS